MPYIALNNAYSTLASGLSNVSTSLTVQTGNGALFAVGTDYSFLTLQDGSNNIEVVKVTARVSDSLTIVRAQDGTVARAWNIGDIVECRPCKAAMQAMQNEAVQVSTTAAASKATPVDADELPIVDSAALNVLKKLTWSNLKATLKTYFDTLYALTGHNHTGTYEPADATILKDADIGVTVQGYDADTVKKDVANTFTATQTPSNNTASVSTTSTYTFDGANQVREITLTNAITVTFGAPTGITENSMYVFKLKAGDTSARTFAWNSAYKWPAATVKLASGTVTNGAKDIITFIGGPSNTLEYVGHQADVR